MRRKQLWTAGSILGVAPLGFLTKAYGGWGAEWVNNSLGGVLYVIFWCLLLRLVWPRSSSKNLAAIVLVGTSLLEVLQLWHPPFQEWVRTSFLGRTLIGTTFVPSDFLYYIIGCLVGWLWIQRLKDSLKADDNITKD